MNIHAVRIHDYGGPEMMRWEQVPQPRAAAGEVLVRVHAAGVNPVDWKTREGARRGRGNFELPATLGCDLSGFVEQLSAGVSAFQVGQAVFGMTGLHGAFAELVAIAADKLVAKPAALDHVHAAAVPLAALTAWQALHMAGLAGGQRLLVHAASGGVGGFAVQFARAMGAEVLATTSAANADYVRGLGATRVIDYHAERFEDVAGKVDVVFDLVGGDTQLRSWRVLQPGGFLVSSIAVEDGGERPEGARVARVGVRSDGSQLAEITKLIEAGKVRVEVARTLPMAQAAEALELNRQGRTRGKIVLTVG